MPFFYAFVVNKDPLLMLTAGCATVCSLMTLYLVMRNRYLRPALQGRGVYFDSYHVYQRYGYWLKKPVSNSSSLKRVCVDAAHTKF